MPFPQPHWLLTFGGPLYSVEEWSCSLRLAGAGGPPDQATIDDALDDATTALTAFVGGACTNEAALAWVKLNRVGTDGKYVASTTNLNDLQPPVPGGGGAPKYPAQVAQVVTLRTAVQRGLAAKGRMFLPAPRPGIGADGRMSAADAAETAGRVQTLLDSLNTLAGIGGVVVASRTREGAMNPVTAVSVGRVLDTMRTRRASLPEDPPAAVPIAGSSTP